jgi:ubiquinone/menaquinone biosynthesis C-methylase UbiE
MKKFIPIGKTDPIKYYSWPVFGKYYWERVRIALEKCNGGNRILEIGFGSGVTFSHLLKKYKKVYGIEYQNPKDISKIKRHTKLTGPNIYLSSGDAFLIPFEKNAFDTVLLISVLEHFTPNHLYEVFKEIHRVLVPGGKLVYGVPIDNLITQIGFRMLVTNIKHYHLSDDQQVATAASDKFSLLEKDRMNLLIPNSIKSKIFAIYEVCKWGKD